MNIQPYKHPHIPTHKVSKPLFYIKKIEVSGVVYHPKFHTRIYIYIYIYIYMNIYTGIYCNPGVVETQLTASLIFGGVLGHLVEVPVVGAVVFVHVPEHGIYLRIACTSGNVVKGLLICACLVFGMHGLV